MKSIIQMTDMKETTCLTLSKAIRILAVLLGSLQLALVISQYESFRFLIDIKAYSDAAYRYLNGYNPYEVVPRMFLYHPLALQFFSLFGNHVKEACLFMYVLAIVAFFYSLIYYAKDSIYPAFLGAAYTGVGLSEIAGGNITLPLHMSIMAALAATIKSRSYSPIYIAVVLFAAIFKPYMIAYLFIPPAISIRKDPEWIRRARPIIYAVVVLVLVIAANYMLFPELNHEFIKAVATHTLIKGDLGQGVFVVFLKLTKDPQFALILHLFVTSIIFIPILYKITKRDDIPLEARAFYFYFFFTMISPRLKEYDLAAALIALFISFNRISIGMLRDTVLFVGFGVSCLRLLTLYAQHENPMLVISGFAFYLTVAILTIGISIEFHRDKQGKTPATS